MKKYLPLILASPIIIGLITLILSSGYLLYSINDSLSVQHNHLILENSSIPDTLFVVPLLNKVPTFKNGGKAKSIYLNLFPATLNWIVFHCIFLSLGTASLIFLIFIIYKLKIQFGVEFFSKTSFRVVLPLLIVVIFITFIYTNFVSNYLGNSIVSGDEMMKYFNIVFSEPKKTIGYIVNSYFLIGLFPLIGILVINLALTKFDETKSANQKDLETGYNTLRDRLNVFALFSGFLIAISIIGTSLQKKMIAEQVIGIEKIYPVEFVYAYGISFTLILALFFIPSLVYLKYFKDENNINIIDKTTVGGWWKIGKESVDDIKLIFSIFLPLISSIIESFIK